MRLVPLAFLLLLACGPASPSAPSAPSFDLAALTPVHVGVFQGVAQEVYTTKTNEVYIEVGAWAEPHDAANQPLSLSNLQPAEMQCWFTENGTGSFAAPARGNPARCGFGGYVELPRHNKKAAVYWTITFDSLVGAGYVYDASANEVPTSVTLRLR